MGRRKLILYMKSILTLISPRNTLKCWKKKSSSDTKMDFSSLLTKEKSFRKWLRNLSSEQLSIYFNFLLNFPIFFFFQFSIFHFHCTLIDFSPLHHFVSFHFVTLCRAAIRKSVLRVIQKCYFWIIMRPGINKSSLETYTMAMKALFLGFTLLKSPWGRVLKHLLTG